jgi:hypothetical protein
VFSSSSSFVLIDCSCSKNCSLARCAHLLMLLIGILAYLEQKLFSKYISYFYFLKKNCFSRSIDIYIYIIFASRSCINKVSFLQMNHVALLCLSFCQCICFVCLMFVFTL